METYENAENLISVILPVYNREQKLSASVNSVLSQSHKELELILVDDGSTDGTRELCRSLSEEHENVTAVRKENGGPASARNRGLSIARGSYIAFMDSDDSLEPSMYELLIGDLERTGADIAICGAGETSVLDNTHEIMELLTGIRRGCGWSVWNKVYKRELISDIRFNEELRINEDLDFNMKAFSKAASVCMRKDDLYHYDISGDGLSRDTDPDRNLSAMEAIEGFLSKEAEELYGKGAILNLEAELLNQGLMGAEKLLLKGELNGESSTENEIRRLMELHQSRGAEQRLRPDQRPLLAAFMKGDSIYRAAYYAELPVKLMLGGGEIYKRVKEQKAKGHGRGQA